MSKRLVFENHPARNELDGTDVLLKGWFDVVGTDRDDSGNLRYLVRNKIGILFSLTPDWTKASR